MKFHRTPDKTYVQLTAAETEVVYLYAGLICADPDRHDGLADNDLNLCRDIVARLDEAKSITKPQWEFLLDVAGRAGLDRSRLDFRETGLFRPGFGSDETIAANADLKDHTARAIQVHLARRSGASSGASIRSATEEDRSPQRQLRDPNDILAGALSVEDLLPPTEEETLRRFIEHLADTLDVMSQRGLKPLAVADQIDLDDVQTLHVVTANLSDAHSGLAAAYRELSAMLDRLSGVNKLF